MRMERGKVNILSVKNFSNDTYYLQEGDSSKEFKKTKQSLTLKKLCSYINKRSCVYIDEIIPKEYVHEIASCEEKECVVVIDHDYDYERTIFVKEMIKFMMDTIPSHMIIILRIRHCDYVHRLQGHNTGIEYTVYENDEPVGMGTYKTSGRINRGFKTQYLIKGQCFQNQHELIKSLPEGIPFTHGSLEHITNKTVVTSGNNNNSLGELRPHYNVFGSKCENPTQCKCPRLVTCQNHSLEMGTKDKIVIINSFWHGKNHENETLDIDRIVGQVVIAIGSNFYTSGNNAGYIVKKDLC